jgi:DNA-3-methyladenine glycosylase II
MTPGDSEARDVTVDVRCREPFDLDLSLRAMGSFGQATAASGPTGSAGERDIAPQGAAARAAAPVLRLGVWLESRPTLLEIRQVSVSPAVVRAEARPASSSSQSLRALTERVANAELELAPFYELAASHPVLGPLTKRFYGLKPFRPAGLFDMLVTAVIEQQISLVAARHIRDRVVDRFGAEAEDQPVFPTPATLAAAPLEELTECGLSRRKAEYVKGAAEEIVNGTLDLDALEQAGSQEVRARISALRGFGPWSAEYVLIRGLARPDAVPVDDLGIRTVVGTMLGDGSRPSSTETASLLAPLAPYRGLAAFYLLVAARLT